MPTLRIQLAFVINCAADDAWRALHSTAAVAALYGPLLRLEGVGEIPTQWTSGGSATVRLSVAGLLPLGSQTIEVTDSEQGKVRTFNDHGRPLTGPLALLSRWDHRMSVVADPRDASRTLWRDRLEIGGAVAPLLYPTLWATWQWRRSRIEALAPSWPALPA